MRKREVSVLPVGLAAWRKQRNLTQEQLAQAAGISPTLVALIETGRRQPGLANAIAIAEALDVPLAAFALVHEDDDEEEVA